MLTFASPHVFAHANIFVHFICFYCLPIQFLLFARAQPTEGPCPTLSPPMTAGAILAPSRRAQKAFRVPTVHPTKLLSAVKTILAASTGAHFRKKSMRTVSATQTRYFPRTATSFSARTRTATALWRVKPQFSTSTKLCSLNTLRKKSRRH